MRRIPTLVLMLALAGPPVLAGPPPAKPAPPSAQSPEKSSEKSPEKSSGKDSEEAKIPSGSGDYQKMLNEVVRYKKGAITFEQLTRFVVAAKLPPHPLGCAYVIAPVPAPPPGTPFNPALMPRDWEHTFGEVAMTHWAGKLTRDEYDRLHDAAHRAQPGFPSCGSAKPKR